jgi:xanthine dehydrogenase accessory factor
MAVAMNGDTLGTVGGGLLEAEILALAEAVLRERRPALRTFSLAGLELSEDGMVCGGRMEILVECLEGPAAALYGRIVRNLDLGRSCRVVRSIGTAAGGGAVETGLAVADEDGFHAGSCDLSLPEVEKRILEVQGTEPFLIEAGPVRYFVETAVPPDTLFLFGGGHVGRELAPLAALAGFRTVVLDDRREFAGRERFPAAAETVVLDSYENCCEGLRIGRAGYVVIMTRGHAFDREVLSSALKTPARYVGMIASRRKRDTIFRFLREEGIPGGTLAKVHSPIGLDIGARTPFEIAVSIVAELIAVRSGAASPPGAAGEHAAGERKGPAP